MRVLFPRRAAHQATGSDRQKEGGPSDIKNGCNLNVKQEKSVGLFICFYISKQPVFPQRIPVLWRNRVVCSFLHQLQAFRPYI